jgi:hypothetical protein
MGVGGEREVIRHEKVQKRTYWVTHVSTMFSFNNNARVSIHNL